MHIKYNRKTKTVTAWRKTLLIALVLCGTANAAPLTPYFGVKLALDTGSWHLRNPQDNSNTYHFGANGQALGIFAGLNQALTTQTYLAGELFFVDSSVKTANKVVGLGTTAKLRATYRYGASLLPGYYLTSNTMLFDRLGVVQTEFVITQRPGGQQHHVVTGGQAGVGLALSLNQNLTLRGEYTYSSYASFSGLRHTITPRSNEISVGFLYQWR